MGGDRDSDFIEQWSLLEEERLKEERPGDFLVARLWYTDQITEGREYFVDFTYAELCNAAVMRTKLRELHDQINRDDFAYTHLPVFSASIEIHDNVDAPEERANLRQYIASIAIQVVHQIPRAEIYEESRRHPLPLGTEVNNKEDDDLLCTDESLNSEFLGEI